MDGGEGRIQWKVHLSAPPERVYRLLSTAEGRARFWARSAEQQGDEICFRFADGTTLSSRLLAADPGHELRLTYFGGSVVTFRLSDDGRGGTVLDLTEESVPAEHWRENLPGWVSVLLCLKAAADHGVDLRNQDPSRGWGEGYVDA